MPRKATRKPDAGTQARKVSSDPDYGDPPWRG